MDGKREALTFRYTNWRGETAVRTATPISLRWGTTEWHPKPDWLLRAYDHEKRAEREFALADCQFALPAEPDEAVVERIGQALAKSCGHQWGCFCSEGLAECTCGDAMPERSDYPDETPSRESFRDLARAALAAMGRG